PLIEHFNGHRWTVADASTADGALFGVSCVSKTFCMAVGATGSGGTLVERDTRGLWTVMSSPNGATFASPGDMSHLESVSCVSTTRCIAVGAEIGGATRSVIVAQQLIESYDGTGWTV